ncbi:MAG TPA: FAD-linked oxidase C-terminal domain-containing protein [Candidatus Kapabacteria bacterium]|nr:FAD-linked oxidase C-terminal domain-containing protein [Candidatus Kapabacteria bacterium]
MSKDTAAFLKRLQKRLPAGELRLEPEILQKYSGDKWFATARPDAVAFPANTESVATIMKFATKHHIPVTPRGAGYGYVGGCVPLHGGIVLSLEKMDRILEINPDDFVAVVQPGVKTATLQNAVEAKRRFYPPDPASRADSSIGGNIATNAGGPRCLKYGVTREYVLGVEAVLADGSVVRLGSRTHKNKTGFDLTKLFVGSEGMLGIVTEATLKLLPLPPFRAALGVGFNSMPAALGALKDIFGAGFLPCALEVADAFTLAAAQKRTGSDMLSGCRAHLIVELDGHVKSVRSELKDLENVLQNRKPLFVQRALGAEACEGIWQLRREFSFALRDTGLTKLNEDIVVPRGKLQELFDFTNGLEKAHGFPVACFGHAGDGNIHVNIMVDMQKPGAKKKCDLALDALFRKVVDLGGVVTGEHGIGIAKKPWWPLATSPSVRKLHHAVKGALDPHGILNPGKFLG